MCPIDVVIEQFYVLEQALAKGTLFEGIGVDVVLLHQKYGV